MEEVASLDEEERFEMTASGDETLVEIEALEEMIMETEVNIAVDPGGVQQVVKGEGEVTDQVDQTRIWHLRENPVE